MARSTIVEGTPNKRTGKRHRMPGSPGSHVAYAQGGDLVVEWYDFGPDAPYESANLMIFGSAAQARLAVALAEPSPLTPAKLAVKIAARFQSYFDVKIFARAQGTLFARKVEFQP